MGVRITPEHNKRDFSSWATTTWRCKGRGGGGAGGASRERGIGVMALAKRVMAVAVQ